ncbi:MAG: hypothetical protein GQ507_02335 [Dehalococcoidales bacterium]|nr:hypothetical protein [Dehalococcoidales bacterium]
METINGVVYWERGDFTLLIKGLSPEQAKKRHDARYAMFRVQTELEGGNKAEPEHQQFARKILKYEGAGQAVDFAKEWDIGRVDPDFEIVQRLWTIYQEHSQMMNRITVTIQKGDTAETLAKKEHEAMKRESRRQMGEAKKAEKQSGK